MAWTTLVRPQELARAMKPRNGGDRAPMDILVLDVRHSLQDPEAGPRLYREGHVPGALHAHVDRDLSSPVRPDTGRHPLPGPDEFRQKASAWGIGPRTQVVAYDDNAGAWASRVWWLLRDYGHHSVALLDGGLQAWLREGFPLETAGHARRPARFAGTPGRMPRAEAKDLLHGGWLPVDARTPERYRAEKEPIDPVAGHIPGAVNLPFAGNVGPDGFFLPPDQLRSRFQTAVANTPVSRVACYCGSGVTGPLNILAMEVAGLRGAALYPGSWSDWIRDPKRPVAKGPEPGAIKAR